MPSDGALCMPAKTQAITTPTANIAPTRRDNAGLTNSPQYLHFFASAWISSAQKGHFRIHTLAKAVSVAVDDIGFSPSNIDGYPEL